MYGCVISRQVKVALTFYTILGALIFIFLGLLIYTFINGELPGGYGRRSRTARSRTARSRTARSRISEIESDILSKQKKIAKLRVAINKAKEELDNAVAGGRWASAKEVKTTLEGLEEQVVVVEEELKVLKDTSVDGGF